MRNENFLGWLIASVVRVLALTLRIHLDDESGLRRGAVPGPVLWTFWHNRMLLVPVIRSRYYMHRSGAVLTSASKDGALLAAVMKQFGLDAVRGSSSRRGTAAFLALTDWVKAGQDVAITPDGPRGPCYTLSPGVVKLAQVTGAPIQPIHVEYSRCVRLKSWDRFMIPLPFSRVDVTFDALFHAPDDAEEAQAQLDRIMQPKNP